MKRLELISIDEMILIAVSSNRRYGLEMIRFIEDVTEGKRKIAFGTMYPALYRLEKYGLVKSEWGDEKKQPDGPRRKYYRITVKGQTALSNAKSLRRLLGL